MLLGVKISLNGIKPIKFNQIEVGMAWADEGNLF